MMGQSQGEKAMAPAPPMVPPDIVDKAHAGSFKPSYGQGLKDMDMIPESMKKNARDMEEFVDKKKLEEEAERVAQREGISMDRARDQLKTKMMEELINRNRQNLKSKGSYPAVESGT